MHRTLLLCFIHGFKFGVKLAVAQGAEKPALKAVNLLVGDDDTFANFPEHLRALVSHALPNITVKAVTYPKFETRGDLSECVGRFKDWLQNKIIDLEVAVSTPSPTIDPSVHTILIGHSMGGIVAAETLLAIASDAPIPIHTNTNATYPLTSMAAHTGPTHKPPPSESESPSFMFPYIQGILAFDTPYLGIAPGVIAHGAEQHYKTATTAYSALSEVAGVFGYTASSSTNPSAAQPKPDSQKLLTQGADAMTASISAANSGTAATPAWKSWGKYAMFAGAAGAVAAGGAAAYLKRDTITEGWSFIGSHLEFVGCLAKGEELKSRLERIIQLNKTRNIGFANLITVLGKGAPAQKRPGTTVAGGVVEIGAVEGIAPSERTFCTVPKSEKNRLFFQKAKNDKATDEINAHMFMFTAKQNSGYFLLGERARNLVVQWVQPEKSEWYRDSEPEKKGLMDVDLGPEEVPNTWAGEERNVWAAEAERPTMAEE